MGGLLSKDSLGSFLSIGQNHGVHFLGAKGLGSLATILLLVGLERLLDHHLLELVAVLLIHVVTGLFGLLFAVLGVSVLLGLLRASLHFELVYLFRFKIAVLLLLREEGDV